jgi:hypothetical protein
MLLKILGSLSNAQSQKKYLKYFFLLDIETIHGQAVVSTENIKVCLKLDSLACGFDNVLFGV